MRVLYIVYKFMADREVSRDIYIYIYSIIRVHVFHVVHRSKVFYMSLHLSTNIQGSLLVSQNNNNECLQKFKQYTYILYDMH